MSLEADKQRFLPIAAMIIVIAGFGMAILLESEVLLIIAVILPFLVALWVTRIQHLRLTRQCLERYLQKFKRSNDKENNNAMPSL